MKKSRFFLWLDLLAFAATGIALYIIAPANEGDLPHPLNGLLREIHGISAMLGVFMFGYMFADHAQKKIARKKHHWDGYLHIGIWAVLIASGLLLYYPLESIETGYTVNLHWYAGIALCCCFPLHFWRKKITRWLVRRNIIKRRFIQPPQTP